MKTPWGRHCNWLEAATERENGQEVIPGSPLCQISEKVREMSIVRAKTREICLVRAVVIGQFDLSNKQSFSFRNFPFIQSVCHNSS